MFMCGKKTLQFRQFHSVQQILHLMANDSKTSWQVGLLVPNAIDLSLISAPHTGVAVIPAQHTRKRAQHRLGTAYHVPGKAMCVVSFSNIYFLSRNGWTFVRRFIILRTHLWVAAKWSPQNTQILLCSSPFLSLRINFWVRGTPRCKNLQILLRISWFLNLWTNP